MSSKSKPTLVEYRRNSSDMEMSSSDGDNDVEEPKPNKTEGALQQIEVNSKSGESAREERLHEWERLRDSKARDDRKNESRHDRRSNDHDRRERRRDSGDSRRSHHERSKRSSERSHGHNHHRHRSRSPVRQKRSPIRHKHSPPRRDSVKRDRKRSHSPDRPRKKSPEPFRSKRLERKAARIDKLGLELIAEPKAGLCHFPNMANNARDVEAKTGVAFPNYYNPTAMNPARYAQQIQKRRLLWGAKKEVSQEQSKEQPGGSGTVKAWEAATFKGDNDGKMTEKFKRLMGIKNDTPGGSVPVGSEINQKQEEMFSNMEAQYQVARMATHTHRGIGLGFGTFQVPPQ